MKIPNLRTNNQGDILIVQGGAIRAAGIRNGKGIVSGLLVRFTTADETDWYETFFDAQTNFRLREGMTSPIYYDHAMDGVMGTKVLGEGVLSLSAEGVAIEGEVDVSDESGEAIYKRAEAGELGWSSGTAGHLVEYTQVRTYAVHGANAWHVDHWPLGLDASLTPWPADPKNVATVRSIRSRLGVGTDEEAAKLLLENRRRANLMRADLLAVGL